MIDSPVWEDEDEIVEKEIRNTLGLEQEDNGTAVARVLPSTSEQVPTHALSASTGLTVSTTSGLDSLPRVNIEEISTVRGVESGGESFLSSLAATDVIINNKSHNLLCFHLELIRDIEMGKRKRSLRRNISCLEKQFLEIVKLLETVSLSPISLGSTRAVATKIDKLLTSIDVTDD